MSFPPLALTLGEPAGIGPEVSLKAWPYCRSSKLSFFVIGPVKHFQNLTKHFKIPTPIYQISSPDEADSVFSKGLPVLDIGNSVSGDLGKIDRLNTKLVIQIIETAVNLVKTGQASGIVTSPIHKDALYKAGFQFPGHTEFLSNLDKNNMPVMMLTSPMLRVIPITIHVPFRKVTDILSTSIIIKKVQIAAEQLSSHFDIIQPRFAVAGLNPHAGEGGYLGSEEICTINPAVEELQKLKINAFGPVSPDALFLPETRNTYDAAICMYHDQALIPIKAIDPNNTVNVTLGLSFVRTSPDHGTALNIAKKGIAKANSMIKAIELACKMVINHQGLQL